jgi:hypothetical protein
MDDRNKSWVTMMIQIKVFEIVNWIEKQDLTEDQMRLITETVEKKNRINHGG